ncbi:MAG: asparagine synthase-related protein [Thermoplasmatota archaeon]|jgi:hypothetical protein
MEKIKLTDDLLMFLTTGFAPYKDHPELKLGKYNIDDYYNALYKYVCSFSGNIAITLSGGKDSRLLAELCNKAGHTTTTITFGYDRNGIENRIAEKVSKTLGMKHIFLAIKPEMYIAANFQEMIQLIKFQNPWEIPDIIYHLHKPILSCYDAVLDGYALTLSAREQRFYRPKNTLSLMFSLIHFDEIITPKYRENVRSRLIARFKDMTKDEFNFFITFDMFAEKYNAIKKYLFNLCIPFFDSGEIRNIEFSIPEKDIVQNIFRKYNLCTAKIQMTSSPFPLWFPWYIHYGYSYFHIFMSNMSGLKSKIIVNQGVWLEHRDKYADAIRKLCNDINLKTLLKEGVFDKQVFMEKMNNVNCREDYALVMERLVNYYFWKVKNNV